MRGWTMSNETELRDFLKREAASTRKAGNILLVFGIVLVIFLIGLYAYTVGRLNREWQAEGIIELVWAEMTVRVDEVMDGFEEQALNYAPEIMDRAKNDLVAYMPQARKRAEELLSKAADDLAEKIREQAGDQVSDIMLRHEGTISRALAAASDIEKGEAELALKAAFEEEFEALAVRELDPNLPEYERVLKEMDAELTLLVESDPEELTDEQKLERELLQIINTLLERKFGQLRAG